MNRPPNHPEPDDDTTMPAQAGGAEPLKATANLVYLLQALSFVLGVTSIIGVVVNYVRLDDVRGTWLESHFVWQIRTFWFQVLWGLVGLVTSVVLIGFLIWGVAYLWVIYRVVKGWINLADDRPMYAD
jgi:uncharacterized membrane protein